LNANLEKLLQKEPNVLATFDLLEVDTYNVKDVIHDITQLVTLLFANSLNDDVIRQLFVAHFAFMRCLSFLSTAQQPLLIRYWMRTLIAIYIVQKQPKIGIITNRNNRMSNDVDSMSLSLLYLHSYSFSFANVGIEEICSKIYSFVGCVETFGCGEWQPTSPINQ
jgi:hypothetical protein